MVASGTPATGSARGGRPARWEGAILDRIVDRLADLGGFAPADWSSRSLVRVGSQSPTTPPFFLAQTGHEWVVTLRFLVKRGAFKAAVLERLLNLKPFHETPTPVLSSADRVALGHYSRRDAGDRRGRSTPTPTWPPTPSTPFFVQAAISYQKSYGIANPTAAERADATAMATEFSAPPAWKVLPAPNRSPRPNQNGPPSCEASLPKAEVGCAESDRSPSSFSLGAICSDSRCQSLTPPGPDAILWESLSSRSPPALAGGERVVSGRGGTRMVIGTNRSRGWRGVGLMVLGLGLPDRDRGGWPGEAAEHCGRAGGRPWIW